MGATKWITLKELAESTRLQTRTLQYMVAREPGVLVTRIKGKVTQYDLGSCVANLLKREREKAARAAAPKNASDSRDRLLAAQAEQAELQVKKMRGELIPPAVAAAENQRWMDIVRARFTAIPGRLAPQMVELPTAPIAQAKLEDAINEALRATQRDAEEVPDVDEDEVANS